ncbi:hypothetical protein [Pseudonocardia kunmingensis]|uniref:Uncharacterized protein n=1 Tax=Pseudonocardia kunmingensis TaxID=630975 RepID=A0A543DZG9_9PSEU|nr:hypothetical protein [Pseudonocardia kunmingensis]TQM14743.1 hypothetical protein FB558_1517 [Pseudonocardia kunmingensis]
MDLRFAAFELITRDAVLRALLVNYADRIDQARVPEPPAPASCFLALAWSGSDRVDARDGAQLLAARAHLPRRLAERHAHLDAVLARLRAALTAPAARGVISTRCLPPPRAAVEDGADTIFKTRMFEISPAAPRGSGAALLELAPWPGQAPVGAAPSLARRGAVPSMN